MKCANKFTPGFSPEAQPGGSLQPACLQCRRTANYCSCWTSLWGVGGSFVGNPGAATIVRVLRCYGLFSWLLLVAVDQTGKNSEFMLIPKGTSYILKRWLPKEMQTEPFAFVEDSNGNLLPFFKVDNRTLILQKYRAARLQSEGSTHPRVSRWQASENVACTVQYQVFGHAHCHRVLRKTFVLRWCCCANRMNVIALGRSADRVCSGCLPHTSAFYVPLEKSHLSDAEHRREQCTLSIMMLERSLHCASSITSVYTSPLQPIKLAPGLPAMLGRPRVTGVLNTELCGLIVECASLTRCYTFRVCLAVAFTPERKGGGGTPQSTIQ